jgi:Phage integrase family
VPLRQAIRPSQPKLLDRRTAEKVDFLFTFRARRVGTTYINTMVIPMLCRKAGVPATDVRGAITSHRARSTIASQLYNAKEPMTLFELQAWLGHRSPQSTVFYAKTAPTTLARAHRDAGYFARNMRTIEVLIDRDAVTSGTTVTGQPWQYYDLGHGYCTYTFFEQCPHRMASAVAPRRLSISRTWYGGQGRTVWRAWRAREEAGDDAGVGGRACGGCGHVDRLIS